MRCVSHDPPLPATRTSAVSFGNSGVGSSPPFLPVFRFRRSGFAALPLDDDFTGGAAIAEVMGKREEVRLSLLATRKAPGWRKLFAKFVSNLRETVVCLSRNIV